VSKFFVLQGRKNRTYTDVRKIFSDEAERKICRPNVQLIS